MANLVRFNLFVLSHPLVSSDLLVQLVPQLSIILLAIIREHLISFVLQPLISCQTLQSPRVRETWRKVLEPIVYWLSVGNRVVLKEFLHISNLHLQFLAWATPLRLVLSIELRLELLEHLTLILLTSIVLPQMSLMSNPLPADPSNYRLLQPLPLAVDCLPLRISFSPTASVCILRVWWVTLLGSLLGHYVMFPLLLMVFNGRC